MHDYQNIMKVINNLLSPDSDESNLLNSGNGQKAVRCMLNDLSFRSDAQVCEFVRYKSYEEIIFELCPKCGSALERTYQAYCANCGQKLKWINPEKMTERY